MDAEGLQSAFLDAVHDEQWRSADDMAIRHPSLAHELTPATRHRFFIYRSSYWARVTTSLARSVYAPAAEVLGYEFVVHLLRAYFLEYPPHHEMLDRAAWYLVDFCRGSSLCADCPWAADLFGYCDIRWRLLAAPEPQATEALKARLGLSPAEADMTKSSWADANEASLLGARLVGPAAVIRSAYPLADLLGLGEWRVSADPLPGEQKRIDLARAQSVLLCRKDSLTLLRVPVEPMTVAAVLSFAEALAEGLNLAEALGRAEGLAAAGADETLIREGLQSFVTSLAREGLFGLSPVPKP